MLHAHISTHIVIFVPAVISFSLGEFTILRTDFSEQYFAAIFIHPQSFCQKSTEKKFRLVGDIWPEALAVALCLRSQDTTY